MNKLTNYVCETNRHLFQLKIHEKKQGILLDYNIITLQDYLYSLLQLLDPLFAKKECTGPLECKMFIR